MVTQTTPADTPLCCMSGSSVIARCRVARSIAASSTSCVPSISQKFCLFSKDSLHSGHRFIFSSLEDEIKIAAHFRANVQAVAQKTFAKQPKQQSASVRLRP